METAALAFAFGTTLGCVAFLVHGIVEVILGLSRIFRPILVDIADDLIQAYRYSWELRAGMHRPEAVEPEATPERQDFDAWLAKNTGSEAEEGHLIGMWEAVAGVRKVPTAKAREYQSVLLGLGCPIPGTPTMTMGG